MSMTVSVRIKPMKQRGIAGQLAHDHRRGAQPQYIDASRTASNTATAEPTAGALVQHARNKCSKTPRSDWAPVWSGIITWGTAAQQQIAALAPAGQDALYRAIAGRIADYLKVDLHYVAVHRDESAPHAHFMICGISDDTGKSIRPKPADMKRLQDIAGASCSHLGINRGVEKSVRIARGEDYSKTVHRSVKQLHQDLPHEIQSLEKTRDNLAALFKRLPKPPQPVEVEIIKKRRVLLSPITETQKVITNDQRRDWFNHSKSHFAEYFSKRESEIDKLKDQLISDRYSVSQKMREMEQISEVIKEQSALLKREINMQHALNHARDIKDEALSIHMPSLNM